MDKNKEYQSLVSPRVRKGGRSSISHKLTINKIRVKIPMTSNANPIILYLLLLLPKPIKTTAVIQSTKIIIA